MIVTAVACLNIVGSAFVYLGARQNRKTVKLLREQQILLDQLREHIIEEHLFEILAKANGE